MGFLKFIRVGIAEAEHLLHEAHSPKEIVLGLTEDVLRALATGTLPDVPPPPVSTEAPVVVAAPSPDPRIDALVAAVAAQQRQMSQLLSVLTQPAPQPAAAAPPPVPTEVHVVPPDAPPAERLPSQVPQTTTAPTFFPVPVPKT